MHDYDVYLLEDFHYVESDLFIVDENVLKNYPFLETKNTISIKVLESEKDLHTVISILEILDSQNIKRDSKVTFVGGGALQDLATIATSVYLRGINWVYMPTTFQAMIDSCIGGKSSINFNQTKNMIGNFYPPHEVYIWTEFLTSLDPQHIVCGLVEGLKICAAGESKHLDEFLNLSKNCKTLKFTKLEFEEIIWYCLNVKKGFIEADEFDKGKRKLLNFGHTFGHAIESSSDYFIPHGIAVALGILAAHELARLEGLIDVQTTNLEIATLSLLSFIDDDTRRRTEILDFDKIINGITKDKKSLKNLFTFILPCKNGFEVYKTEISPQNNSRIVRSIHEALKRIAK